MTGKQHSAINLSSAVIASGLYVQSNSTNPLIIAFGILYSIISSPDTDVDNGFIGHYFFRRAFGNIGSWYWEWEYLWKPYARNFTHRGISHMPIVGTLIRLIYIILPTSMYLLPRELDVARIIDVLFAQVLAIPFTMLFIFTMVTYPIETLLFVLGIIIGDVIHIACDHLSTGTKKLNKKLVNKFKVNR